jgi:hypothetical protein
VGHVRGLDRRRGFQSVLAGAFEHTDAAAQKNGDEVDLDLVEQTGLEILLSLVRATDHLDVVTCRRPSLLERNVRRGHYELTVVEPVSRRLAVAFDELALAIGAVASGQSAAT